MSSSNDSIDNDSIDNDSIDNEYNEYSQLLDFKFIHFHKKNKYHCKALTHLELQCKYLVVDNHILCALHRKKKTSSRLCYSLY